MKTRRGRARRGLLDGGPQAGTGHGRLVDERIDPPGAEGGVVRQPRGLLEAPSRLDRDGGTIVPGQDPQQQAVGREQGGGGVGGDARGRQRDAHFRPGRAGTTGDPDR